MSKFDVTVPKAKRSFDITYNRAGVMQPWKTKIKASEARVFVEAATGAAKRFVTDKQAQYEIEGLKGDDADKSTYGLSEKITMDKQDFQGIKAAYEFDPVAEKYVPVDPMEKARWYPTLVGLQDGKVLAVSGLDDVGVIDPGDNEIYDRRPRSGRWGPSATSPRIPPSSSPRAASSSTRRPTPGTGPPTRAASQGLWDLKTNKFQKVPGLADMDETETSASLALLPPAQDQKVMIMGGGGVGESGEGHVAHRGHRPQGGQPVLQDRSPGCRRAPAT